MYKIELASIRRGIQYSNLLDFSGRALKVVNKSVTLFDAAFSIGKGSRNKVRLIVAVGLIRRTLFDAVYWLQSDGRSTTLQRLETEHFTSTVSDSCVTLHI